MSDIRLPEHLRYDLAHMWVQADGLLATIGVSDPAQRLWGQVDFAQLPRSGSKLVSGEAFGQLVCGTAGPCDLMAPVSGRVAAVNDSLSDDPSRVNSDPYGEGWLLRIEMSDPAELRDLLDAGAYRRWLEESPPEDVNAALGSLFKHSTDAMLLIDQHRRILAMNLAAERLTGFQAREIVGEARCYHLFRCGAEGDVSHGMDCFGVFSSQAGRIGGCSHFTIHRKDGSGVNISASYSPVPRKDGQGMFMLISFRKEDN
ncbi:MAG TPA: PAS domain S-box protein [Armatimonadota bacterium]|jgi:glycine cleavage system H protein